MTKTWQDLKNEKESDDIIVEIHFVISKDNELKHIGYPKIFEIEFIKDVLITAAGGIIEEMKKMEILTETKNILKIKN